MKANDIPVTDLELSQIYGEPKEDTSAADKSLFAITMIPECDFTPAVAKEIILRITSRIYRSNFSHIQTKDLDAVAAIESLDDAHSYLGGYS